MKSRITIEVDLDASQPYIKVINDTTTSDVRDKLITAFRQRLGHTSSWCKITFPSYAHPLHPDQVVFEIHAIRPDQLSDEAKIMLEQATMNVKTPEASSVSH